MRLNKPGLLLLSICFACPTYADTVATLRSVIAERLAVMHDVAAYKWAHGLPVEDVEREAVVERAALQQAAEAGVPGERAQAMIHAQIEAAKLVQARWFAVWREHGNAPPAPDLVAEMRPRISQLTSELIARLAELPDPPLSPADRVTLQTVPKILRDDEAAWAVAIDPLISTPNPEEGRQDGPIRKRIRP